MAPRRFYTERKNLRIGSSIKLSKREAEHARNSLRLQKGDKIRIFNNSEEFGAVLKLVSKDAVMAEITELIKSIDTSSKKNIDIYQCYIKNSNFELVVQKTTELGVHKVIPVVSEYTQVNLSEDTQKLPRWNRIAIEAAKQSGRLDIPKVVEPVEFDALKQIVNNYDMVILLDAASSDSDTLVLSELAPDLVDAQNIAYIVGPEGGFSSSELQRSKAWGIQTVSLPFNTLRAETAAIVGMGIIKYAILERQGF